METNLALGTECFIEVAEISRDVPACDLAMTQIKDAERLLNYKRPACYIAVR